MADNDYLLMQLVSAYSGSISKWSEVHKGYQQRINKLSVKLREAQFNLNESSSKKELIRLRNEECKQWKESLCEQFQILVQDWGRGRLEKLQNIAELYG